MNRSGVHYSINSAAAAHFLTFFFQWWYADPAARHEQLRDLRSTTSPTERIMRSTGYAVWALMVVACLAGVVWGAEGASSGGEGPDQEYWSVCCRHIPRSGGRMGGSHHCVRCTMGPIRSDYVTRLPSHCRWFTHREQAEEDLYKRHTCP